MLLTTIIFLPAIIALGLMIQFHIRERRWVPLATIPYIVMVCFLHCYILQLEWGDVEVSDRLLGVRSMLVGLGLPAAYIFLCSKSGMKWCNISTLCMCLMALLNLLGGITLSVDGKSTTTFLSDHNVHLILYKGVSFTFRILELIIMLQMLWIGSWYFKMKRRMKEEELHMSQQSKQLTMVIVGIFCVIFVSILIPNSLWSKSVIYINIFIGLLSILIAVAEYMVSRGWMLSPVLDINDEPAVNTVSVDDNLLKKRILELIDEKKAYLNSNLKISDIARELNTNRYYISRAISEIEDCNFNTFINKRRIEEARRMIAENPDVNLEMLAEKIGFNTNGTFTKVFKKLTGMNPSEAKAASKG